MDETDASMRALVRGRVQGVGFRAFVVAHARRLGLRGFARNVNDGGTVEVVAEGPRDSLEALLSLLRAGPPMARVDAVDVSWGDATNAYDGFGVR